VNAHQSVHLHRRSGWGILRLLGSAAVCRLYLSYLRDTALSPVCQLPRWNGGVAAGAFFGLGRRNRPFANPLQTAVIVLSLTWSTLSCGPTHFPLLLGFELRPNQAVQLTPLARPEPGRDLTANCYGLLAWRQSAFPTNLSIARSSSRPLGQPHAVCSAGSCHRCQPSLRLPAAQLTARRWAAFASSGSTNYQDSAADFSRCKAIFPILD
jgi:hypothetical protein